MWNFPEFWLSSKISHKAVKVEEETGRVYTESLLLP
jgi:hypothetical protein